MDSSSLLCQNNVMAMSESNCKEGEDDDPWMDVSN